MYHFRNYPIKHIYQCRLVKDLEKDNNYWNLSNNFCTPSDSPLKKGGGLTNKALSVSKT